MTKVFESESGYLEMIISGFPASAMEELTFEIRARKEAQLVIGPEGIEDVIKPDPDFFQVEWVTASPCCECEGVSANVSIEQEGTEVSVSVSNEEEIEANECRLADGGGMVLIDVLD